MRIECMIKSGRFDIKIVPMRINYRIERGWLYMKKTVQRRIKSRIERGWLYTKKTAQRRINNSDCSSYRLWYLV